LLPVLVSSPSHVATFQILTIAVQIAAALEGFFWPKILFDWLTTNLDKAVKPVPILQIINQIFGICTLLFEWPIKPIAGSSIHQSIEFRLMLFPLLALAAFVMYQSTNAGIYYIVAEIIYFWAFYDGEVRRIQGFAGN
jgi:hypothetical protein